ncbi:hypothetical protein [Streptomyces altiplanensis]
MTVSRLLVGLLATQAVTTLFICATAATTVLVIVRHALRDTPPRHRAAILRSVAEIARALRGRP